MKAILIFYILHGPAIDRTQLDFQAMEACEAARSSITDQFHDLAKGRSESNSAVVNAWAKAVSPNDMAKILVHQALAIPIQPQVYCVPTRQ